MLPSRIVLLICAATTLIPQHASQAGPAASSSSAAKPDLVVVAEPTRSDALAAPGGPVTLAYGVIEIFSGEVSGASVIVRHDALGAEDRARLLSRERVILLAHADPEAEGRYVAPPPLRATPSAVSAFRKWSAPEDVRAARPLSEVVAEITGGPAALRPAPPVPPPSPAIVKESPVAPAKPREPSIPPPPAAPEVIAVASRHAEPLPEVEVDEEVTEPRREVAAARVEPSVNAFESPSVSEAAPLPQPAGRSEHAAPDAWDPPLAIDPQLQPRPGPGLPPSPGGATLGPAVSERTDLRPPPRGGRRQ